MDLAGLVLLDLVLVLAVARLLGAVLERVRQPRVVGEVLAGLVLGASVLGALPGDPSAALFTPDARAVLTTLGQIAVVAYLFSVGAELDARALRREGSAVGLVAIASFLVPFAAGAGVALVVHDQVAGDPPLVAFVLFLATAFGVTALPVLSRIVDARGLGERPAGRIALAAAAAQELLVWPALAVAIALGGSASASPGAVLGLGALALAAIVVLARVVLPRVAGRVPRAAGFVVLAALAASAVATEVAGLHLALGAFLFGAVLPEPLRDAGLRLLRRRAPAIAAALLLPLFFALPALRVDLALLGAGGLGLLAVVLAVAMVTKVASAALAGRVTGLGGREALTVGALMNARGLVELVVLSVGLQAGLIDERLFGVMVLMALVTTLAAGPLVAAIARARGARPVPYAPPTCASSPGTSTP